MLLPRSNRIRLIEPAEVTDRVPQQPHLLLGARLGKHALSPAWAGSGNHRPVRLIARDAFAEWPHAARDDLLHRTDEFGRLILKRVGIVGVDRQDRMTRFSMLQQRIRQPGGELFERIAWRMPVTQELKRFVTPERFDVSCSSSIRTLRNPANKRSSVERRAAVCNRTDDEQPLMRLEVEGDFHGELAVCGERGVMVCSHSAQSRLVAYVGLSLRLPKPKVYNRTGFHVVSIYCI